MSDDMYDDPIDALAELFAEPDPEPSPRFVGRLEADLRIAHAERNRGHERAPVWGRVGALASVAVVVLAVATAGLLFRDRSVSSALELTNARGVVVTLPDGSIVDDPADGFDLPEGTVIVVRLGGSATIDDVSIAEGAVVTVRDGALVTEVTITTTIPGVDARPDADAPDPPTTIHPETDRINPDSPGTEPPIIDRPHDPPAPDDPSTPVPPVDGPRPDPVPAPDRPGVGPPHPPAPGDRPPADPGPLPPGAPTPAPPVGGGPAGPGGPMTPPGPVPPAPGSGLDIGLRVRVRGPHRITLSWSTGPAADPAWRVVVVRTDGDAVPDWPLGPGAVVVGESRGHGASEAVDEPAPGVAVVSYRVVVLDAADGVVARGVVQKVTLP